MSKSFLWVVDHATDPEKKGGFLDSYTPGIVGKDDQGNDIPGIVAFVQWPDLPRPALHAENMDDLIKDDIYVPESEENPALEALRLANEKLQEKYPDIHEEIVEEVKAELAADENDNEDEETVPLAQDNSHENAGTQV